MATPQHSDDERGNDSPAPPPPPPPPPPQDDIVADPPSSSSSRPPLQPSDRARRVDARELLALFHAEDDDDPAARRAQWDHLYQVALAEARDEFRAQQLERKKQKKRAAPDTSDLPSAVSATPTRAGSAGGARLPASGPGAASGSNADKRPRPPALGDADPNKAMRLGRAPPPAASRPKGGASKLMQKLGSRGN